MVKNHIRSARIVRLVTNPQARHRNSGSSLNPSRTFPVAAMTAG